MRVAVVGLGPAGLRSAMLLERAGVDVTAFEARDRVGGRCHTVALPEGGWYEAGAEWVDADHLRVLALLAEFGLSPEPSDARPGRLLCNGAFCPEDEVWEDAALDARHAHEAAVRLAGTLPEAPWDEPTLADLDSDTLGAFLDRVAVSKRGRWLLEATQRSDEGTDTDRVGLLGWLWGYRNYLARRCSDEGMSAFRVAGGFGGLCDRMAATLARPPVMEKPLKGLQVGDDHVELWFADEVAVADRVLLAVPPAHLCRLEVFPEWPDDTASALGAFAMAPVVKIVLQFRSRYWDDPAHSARLLTDLPVQQVWEGGRDGAAALTCYIGGREAERAGRQPEEAAVAEALRALAEVYPVAREEFVAGTRHDWAADPWAGGAFTSLPPGAAFATLPCAARPSGRVHFAGEHTATWLGFVEGALESAERAVQEILDAEAVQRV